MSVDWTRARLDRLIPALATGETTSLEVTEACLEKIHARDGSIGAFLATDPEHARAQATAIDARRAAGEPLGGLAGVPVGIKDMICTTDYPTTAGSRMLEGYVSPYDATVTARLRAADAVILGKLNQDEFAMGSSNESSAYRPCANPWNTDRVPGGSSGGSAAAVAAGFCPVSLGTDTGGSIRQPASFCGVVGLKPTYGRVSRFGVVAFASSLDQVGPLGRSVDDVARVFQAIGGHDPADSTSIPDPLDDVVAGLDADLPPFRVGVPAEYLGEGVNPEVRDAIEAALAVYESAGAERVSVSLPHTDYGIAAYYLLATAEASSNLARYDGVRYGHRTASRSEGVAELISRSRGEAFGAEVKRRIMLGTFVLSAGYYDAYYLKAQKVRTLIRDDFQAAFTRCDMLLTPTSPVTAFAQGALRADPIAMYLNDALTIPASLAGLPCLSQPAGFDSEGLPIGCQLIGPALSEGRLLRYAKAYESLTSWHEAAPPEADDATR